MPTPCTHLDEIRKVEPRTPDGCEECLASGDSWVHLRLCLTCGHVGCCDSSRNRHATKHFHATGHPIVQSFERYEDWSWCYADQLVLEPGDIQAAIARNESGAAAGGDGPDAADERDRAGRPGGLLNRLLGSSGRRNYVVGVIADEGRAQAAVEALRQAGVAAEDVVLQSGSEISARLKNSDLGNLVREATSEEGTLCRDYDEQARGGAVLSVYTRDAQDVERARSILKDHDARSIRHFGDWTISEPPERGLAS